MMKNIVYWSALLAALGYVVGSYNGKLDILEKLEKKDPEVLVKVVETLLK